MVVSFYDTRYSRFLFNDEIISSLNLNLNTNQAQKLKINQITVRKFIVS